jgi:hypothetical protein
MQFLKLVEYLGKSYIVRNLYRKNVSRRSYYSHARKIIDKANSKYNISSYLDLNYVFSQSEFKGLMNTLFQPNSFHFTCQDVAVATVISIRGFQNMEYINSESIIDFSFYFTREIKEKVRLDLALSSELSTIGKDINMIVDDIARDEISRTLSSKKAILQHYFKRFEDRRFNSTITIWHPSEKNPWIEWKDEDSITIPIDINKISAGFFVAGLDYSSDKLGSLRIATSDGDYEYFNDSTKHDEVVWLN